jgi:regulator of RNase E activity RraB
MTPKDRAHNIYRDLAFARGSDSNSLEVIEAAIRAAENDALERAAVRCDEEAAKADERHNKRPDLSDGGAGAAYQEAAAFIRSMKHK